VPWYPNDRSSADWGSLQEQEMGKSATRNAIRVGCNEMMQRQGRELIVHSHKRRRLVRGLKVHTFFFHAQKGVTERNNQDAVGVAIGKETKDANNGVNLCR
jgi:hypothetical protein